MTENRERITIWVASSCKPNPGNGGWAAVILQRGIKTLVCGNEVDTTNNRMELTAIVESLRMLNKPSKVKVISSSKYAVSRAWNKEDGIESYNIDILCHLREVEAQHKVHYMWMLQHSTPEMTQASLRAQFEAENLPDLENDWLMIREYERLVTRDQ